MRGADEVGTKAGVVLQVSNKKTRTIFRTRQAILKALDRNVETLGL